MSLLAGYPAAAIRLMILDRPWADDWDYRPDLLDAAAGRLENLYSAAGRTVPASPGARTGIGRLLAADLNVQAAIETGGAAARTAAAVLGLS